MAKMKGFRTGKKFTRSHTTVIPAAGFIADVADKSNATTKSVSAS